MKHLLAASVFLLLGGLLLGLMTGGHGETYGDKRAEVRITGVGVKGVQEDHFSSFKPGDPSRF